MKPLALIKIGGKLLDDQVALQAALASFASLSGPKILVHGGGKEVSTRCEQMDIVPNMWNGRRITDGPTLEVAVMVYAGLINKQVVSHLQRLGCNALGLCGADGNLILARKRPVGAIDFGWVGDVESINTPLLLALLEQGVIPVFCAITHDGQGQLLNTNADTIAAALATALATDFVVNLKLCFEKDGVLSDPEDDTSVLPSLAIAQYQQALKTGAISDGMIPKLDNAFNAKKAGVSHVIICGSKGIAQIQGTEICL